MRYAERFYIKDVSLREEYIRRHQQIWPQMKALLKEAGFKNYSIWISGMDIFAYYELDDLEHCLRVLAESPVKAQWDAYMCDVICFPDGNAPKPLDQVFLLE